MCIRDRNGIGIEMCVNSDGNYEQTLINTEKLCARLLIEYDLNPSKACLLYTSRCV